MHPDEFASLEECSKYYQVLFYKMLMCGPVVIRNCVMTPQEMLRVIFPTTELRVFRLGDLIPIDGAKAKSAYLTYCADPSLWAFPAKKNFSLVLTPSSEITKLPMEGRIIYSGSSESRFCLIHKHASHFGMPIAAYFYFKTKKDLDSALPHGPLASRILKKLDKLVIETPISIDGFLDKLAEHFLLNQPKREDEFNI